MQKEFLFDGHTHIASQFLKVHDIYVINICIMRGVFEIFKEKRIEIRINKLIEKHGISLRQLGRLADIDISQLSPMARNERQRIDLGHLQRIAEALDIDDINEILTIMVVEDDKTYKNKL